MSPSEVIVVLTAPVCRRCVRRFSRHLADVPGVTALRFDARHAVVRIRGSTCGHAVVAALPAGAVRSYGCSRAGP